MKTTAQGYPRRSLLAVAVAGAIGLSTPAFADTGTTKIRINMREAADLNTPVVTTLSPGTEVKIVGYEGEFAKLETADGQVGYLKSKYLDITKVVVEAPPPPPPPPSEPLAAATPPPPSPPPVAASPVVSAEPSTDDGDAVSLTKISVTGSRLKRADIEGALPVSVITREDIELSGQVTVSELLRDTTFNAFGSFRPASGSSAQSFAEVSLRGLGGGRTLVLLDGRQLPLEPSAADGGSNLNVIPLAAVERVEILQDGASAIYGADAIGGVINIITRKDFDGASFTYGVGQPDRSGGGDTREASLIVGGASGKTNFLLGASYNSREILFARDRPWSSGGASTFSNNYREVVIDEQTGQPSPGGFISGDARVANGCEINELFSSSDTRCFYDFSAIAADEASIQNTSIFGRANYEVNDDWTFNFNASVSRLESFGRYAPVAGFLFTPANTPNNPFDRDLFISHRYAAIGPRDNTVDNQTYDIDMFFTGVVGNADVEVGVRRADSQFTNVGRNYVNGPLAAQFGVEGRYLAADPFGSDPVALAQIAATTGRDSFYTRDMAYGSFSMPVGSLDGGPIQVLLGAEYLDDDYADIYDQASEAGAIEGSSGASSFGQRRLFSMYGEILLPVTSQLELSAAIRSDDYNDFGQQTSPKVSFRYQPTERLTLRGSYGQGFRAPPIPYISANVAFAADSVVDPATATAFGLEPDEQIQISAFRIPNPNLDAEKSDQFSLGAVFSPTENLDLSLDYFNIEVEDQIKFFSSTILLARENSDTLSTPSGLGVTRIPEDGSILRIDTGYGNEGAIQTSGLDGNVTLRSALGAGRLVTDFNVSYFLEYDLCEANGECTDVLDTAPDGEEGGPKYRANLSTTYATGPLSVALNLQYIPSFNTVLADLDPTCGEDPADVCETDSLLQLDLQARYDTPWNNTISLGVDNLTDEDPILDDFTLRGYVTQLSDPYGRTFYARFTQRF